MLADESGARLLPSVVSLPPERRASLVGHAAKSGASSTRGTRSTSVKRLIGRAWAADEIAAARARFAFEHARGAGQAAARRRARQDYTLPEISAFVLRKRARHIAETALGEPVERAVITVPANFNELQRAATKVAGARRRARGAAHPERADRRRARLRPRRATSDERIAVYDFGGGTFDCTLLDLNGNVFEVLATAGDTFLGGDDIDIAIAERMAEAFLTQHRYDPRADPQAFERLRARRRAGEDRALAQQNRDASSAARGRATASAARTLDFDLQDDARRARACSPRRSSSARSRSARTRSRSRKLSPTSFDKVILVGGSTRIPLVRERVEEFFGRAGSIA